jgi:ectoine hydroxylase-related dioxygenase (phytanoyl-CoA dioxygenase family)
VATGSHKSNLEAPFTFERGLTHPPGRDEPVMEWDGAAGLAELQSKYQNAMVEVNAAAGDVVIFHESTTHAVAPWHGMEPRRTLLYAFVPGFMAIQDTPLRMPAWISELTPGQASRFEAPWRSSTKGRGLIARHEANLSKWGFAKL